MSFQNIFCVFCVLGLLAVCNGYDPVTTESPLTASRREATAYLNSATNDLNSKIDNLNAVAASILTPAKTNNLAHQQPILTEISKASNDLLSVLDQSSLCYIIAQDVIDMKDEYISQITYCTSLSTALIDKLWSDVDNAVTNGRKAITDLTAKFNACAYNDMACFTNFKNNAPVDVNAKLAAIKTVLDSLTLVTNTAAMNGNSCRDCSFLNFKTDYNSQLDVINACLGY